MKKTILVSLFLMVAIKSSLAGEGGGGQAPLMNFVLYDPDNVYFYKDPHESIFFGVPKLETFRRSEKELRSDLTKLDQRVTNQEVEVKEQIKDLKENILTSLKNLPPRILNDEDTKKAITDYVNKLFEEKREQLEKQILEKYNLK